MAVRGGISFLVLVALARGALAAQPAPLPVQIDFAAPVGCSNVGAFYAGVLARTDRARRAKPGENGARFRVRLTRAGTRVHGELSVIAERGDNSTRKVDGESCNEVVEVLSLTVALALDPAAVPLANPVSAPTSNSPAPLPPPSPSRPAAPSSATGVGPPGQPPPPTPAVAPGPSAPSAPVAQILPEPARAPVAAPPPVAPTPAEAPPTTVSPELTARPPEDQASPTYAIDLGARAVVAEVVSPYVSVGGGLSLLVTGKRREGVPPSLGVALLYVPNDLLSPSPDVVVRWTALALTACPPLGFRGRVQVQPCLLGIGGWLSATERAVTSPLSATRAWWSTGALVSTTLAVGWGFSIGLDVGVSVPLVKRRFIVTLPPDSTVGETPSVSAIAGIGISRSL